jgi:chemotaxis protein MotB
MRLTKQLAVVASLFGLTLAAGCVKKSTHNAALDELATTQAELDSTRSQNQEKTQEISDLEDAIEEARKNLEEAQTRLQALAMKGEATEEELEQAAATLEATRAELEELRRQRDAAQERMRAYTDLRDKLKALVDTGRLSVEFRDGQMILQLPSAVLFPSGQANLSRSGQASLQEILDILIEFKDRRFMVAGHTDNVPIRGGRFSDNWDLSTSRATSVVNFMVNAGFDPGSLVAAGFGEHAPIESNDSAEGRTANRRIEIILLPDLSGLPQLADDEA